MMNSKIIAKGIVKAFLILCLFFVIGYFLFQIQTILVYLVISLILALIASPLVTFLKNRLKFNNTFAVLATMLLLVSVIFGLIMLFVPLIISQGQNLSVLDTVSLEKSIVQLIDNFNAFLLSHNIDGTSMIKQSNVTSKINFNFIPSFLNAVLGTLSSFGMGLASVLFITFFFLKDEAMFTSGMKKILPDEHEDKILNSIEKINVLLSRYFIGLIIQLTIVFVLYLIVLLIFGVENAFVIAFLCALLNIIPYIGPLIGSLLAGILTMISNLNENFQSEILPTTIYVLIGFWVVQIIDNNISQPIIFSKSVNSHPLEIFLIILISGFLFGIAGMIVAVPAYTIIKVIGKEFFPENQIIRSLTKDI